MNFNYLKIAWRILLKNKVHTVINILGLGLGFSVSILMMIFVYHQLSFDNFHSKAERIYRFTIEGKMTDGKIISGAMTSGEVASVVSDAVPEIEFACRIYHWGANDVLVNEKRFTDDRIHWVDSTFFRIFDFPLVTGDPYLVLTEPFTVVVSKKTADKYFGDEDAIGKVIKIGNLDYRITAIMENVPINSHLQFDMVAAFHTLETPERNVVKNNGISFPTYLLMSEGADMNAFVDKSIHSADVFTNDIFNKAGITLSHSLQALNNVYLHSDFSYDTSTRGDIRNVYIFAFLALIVILIAVFNFVNLVTAQSEKRTREIGMRKVMGALRKDMIMQFMGESLIIALFAFILSLVLNELLIGPFSQLLNETFRLEYWYNPGFLVMIIGFVIITGIAAGIYPAVYLSRFDPVKVLKGMQKTSGRAYFMRKILVIFQFAISIFLVVSVLLLNKQVQYMKKKDLGFERENVVTVRKITSAIRNAYPSLEAELLQNPDILKVTASQSIPGEERSLQTSYKKGDDPASAIMMFENRIQHGFIGTFGMNIIAGRDFDPDMKTDSSAIILNETAVRKLGLEDPIGQEIFVWRHPGKVIGVVSDYNFLSLHNEIDPLALTMYEKWFSRISIRIAPGNTKETLANIESIMQEADPNYTFEYSFVDDLFADMYAREERVNKLITSAAILAIIISFMGLYALTSFTISKKIKEIGIRKTLGASVTNILTMLFKDLSGWIILGNAFAWPIAFYVVTKWKQNFAFQIDLLDNWYLFIVSGLLAASVGVLATIIQALSAANSNPIHSLKSE
jgi:putative ABC transport system permease protein